jgi:hypothetical protein
MNLGSVAKASNHPMKQAKISVLTYAKIYYIYTLCKCNAHMHFETRCSKAQQTYVSHREVLPAGQQWVAICTWYWPQDERQNSFAIRLLKRIVVWLNKAEGLQKWSAP